MKTQLLISIEQLLNYGEINKLYPKRDKIYIRNRYYQLLNVNEILIPHLENDNIETLTNILDNIISLIDENNRANLGLTTEQQHDSLIDIMLPFPSQVEDKFYSLLSKSDIKVALNWYYQFSIATDYIKTQAIAKNKHWHNPSPYGNLEITINLSKPEKDPKEIALLKSLPKSKYEYPSCLLCLENEGYMGSPSKSPRHTHRMLTLNLNHKEWMFQFSPYAYYLEHSIIINPRHEDMHITMDTLNTFFAFVDLIPHYLIGSNSDIPIVGGSILNHDHFQAGNYIFPIEKAKVKSSLIKNNVLIEYLYWPISTLRLNGTKTDILKLSDQLIKKWYSFSAPDLDIIATTNNLRHNAITPILRKVAQDKYQLYLMLRNNRTSEIYPDGIFHPHQELHHIKKENIGLIEAMGLAILPGRLDSEIMLMNNYLGLNNLDLALNKLEHESSMHKHKQWLIDLYTIYHSFNKDNNYALLYNEVGKKFCQVLKDSGVFKHNTDGDKALNQFLNS